MYVKALIFLFSFYSFTLSAQNKISVSGYVKDASTGETLTGASVYVKSESNLGASTNTYGFYTLRLSPGEYTLVFTYLGYADQERKISLTNDLSLNINLSEGVEMSEVVIEAEAADKNVSGTQMGEIVLPIEKIQKIPALMGEVDLLKALQLLPGVQSAGEGSSGFYVRGGGPDQNLVLLDEALVYNSGHLFGFFSVFNSDAIKSANLMKGGMPAQYGGRLSSVVDIQMKEGNNKSYQVDGGIGLIASRLTVQGPIVPDKSSFIISTRRTYALDLAQPAIKRTDFAGTNYYFYDLNAKANYIFSEKDRLFFSAYFGRDVLKFRTPGRDFTFDLPYGNATGTLRWNHLFNNRLFVNTSLIYNDYDFTFRAGIDDFSLTLFSGVRDWNGKVDVDYFPSNNHAIKFGVQTTYHRLTPSVARAQQGEDAFSNNKEAIPAWETGFYVSDDFKVSERIKIQAGLRWSVFTQMGPYAASTGINYQKGEEVVTYNGLEPRLSWRYAFNASNSIKGGVTVSNQYLHLVSNSSSTLPADVWVSSTERIKPQRGEQYALGYFKNIKRNMFEVSAEIYFRTLRNQLDYGESYVQNPADDLEQQFIAGSGRAYGAELLIRKNEGKLTGWIGYTRARTERKFEEINGGAYYPAVYDRTHDLSLVVNYDKGKKWDFSGVFVFGTGRAFTPIESIYLVDQRVVTNYAPRNSSRLPDYHRIDVSANYRPRKEEGEGFYSYWTFSVYNVYNRRNPFFINYEFDTDEKTGVLSASAYKVSLFPIIPSVTWNFKWQQKKN
ncbi:MAG: TonB-dependent receptor [Bacteroidetes bacterium]|nr:TonB-dependent receptor [Bacteroidota bacterium]